MFGRRSYPCILAYLVFVPCVYHVCTMCVPCCDLLFDMMCHVRTGFHLCVSSSSLQPSDKKSVESAQHNLSERWRRRWRAGGGAGAEEEVRDEEDVRWGSKVADGAELKRGMSPQHFCEVVCEHWLWRRRNAVPTFEEGSGGRQKKKRSERGNYKLKGGCTVWMDRRMDRLIDGRRDRRWCGVWVYVPLCASRDSVSQVLHSTILYPF